MAKDNPYYICINIYILCILNIPFLDNPYYIYIYVYLHIRKRTSCFHYSKTQKFPGIFTVNPTVGSPLVEYGGKRFQ